MFNSLVLIPTENALSAHSRNAQYTSLCVTEFKFMDQTILLIKKSNILDLMIFSTRFTHYIHNKKHGNGTKPGFHATNAF